MGALLYGLLLGLGAWLVPGALLGLVVRAVVAGLGDWLGSLQFTIPMPLGESITIDLTSALALGEMEARLSALAGQEVALVLAVALGTAAAGMLLTGLMAFLGALFYNLFAGVLGGLEVKLDALDAPGRRPVAAVATTAPTAAPRNPAVAAAAVAAPQTRPESAAPARPIATAWLTNPDGTGGRLLGDDVTRIGSAPENDIVLPGLAPQHAEIRRESGRYLIYDLGSRRTWVNDAQVAAVHMLKDGFRLQLGQTEFLVHILTTAPTPAEV